MFRIIDSCIFFAMFSSLVSLQKYIEALFFQTDLTASHLSEIVYVSEAYVSTGLISTLYINILVFFLGQVGTQILSQSVKHLFATRICFWISAPMSLLQLTCDLKEVKLWTT
jgi:CBS domain containing-hemolysin-like protein